MPETEKQMRERLIRQARKRAQQIADGSYVDEPWAPSKATKALIGIKKDA
jgi:hypothetical protein